MITRRFHMSDPTAAIAYYQRLLPKWGYRFSDQEPTYFRQNDHVLELSTAVPDQFDIIYLR